MSNINATIDSLESAIVLKRDIVNITSKAGDTPADLNLLRIVMGMITSHTNIDTEEDIIASLESRALPGYGLEGRLSKLGKYIKDGMIRIFKITRQFFSNDNASIDTAKAKLIEVSKSASDTKQDGEYETTTEWHFPDGDIRRIEETFELQKHIVDDMSSYLDTALSSIGKVPTVGDDRTGTLDSLSDTINDVNVLKHTLVGILVKSNNVLYGDDSKVEIHLTATRILKLELGKLDLDDLPIDEKLKGVTSFNTRLAIGETEPLKVPYLAPDAARSQTDRLLGILSKLSTLYHTYQKDLDHHEKLIDKQMRELPEMDGKVGTHEKALDQLRLTVMKIHARVYAPVFHNLVSAINKHIPYLEACVK